MIPVKGIILILSCQKHLNTRVKNFKLSQDEYAGWKVVYVIGDLFLEGDYKVENNEHGYNLMTIKCEDSYIHLLKKLVLSLKYLYEIYDIKEGVLRGGDDLMFNEELLQAFVMLPKVMPTASDAGDSVPKTSNSVPVDFLGKSPSGRSLLAHEISDADIKATINDTFMVDYYKSHPEDFDNPYHNLKGVDISKYMKRPHIPVGPCGIMFYLSNKSCKILIEHLDSIGYNIFHYDEGTDSYPYTIEDCAVSFILYSNKISFIHTLSMYDEYYNNPEKVGVLAIHTNLNKY
jgi:hypothetical protein